MPGATRKMMGTKKRSARLVGLTGKDARGDGTEGIAAEMRLVLAEELVLLSLLWIERRNSNSPGPGQSLGCHSLSASVIRLRLYSLLPHTTSLASLLFTALFIHS